MRRKKVLLTGASLVLSVLASPAAYAQTLHQTIQNGDTVVGMGTLTHITNIFINDSGVWLAAVGTDFILENRDEAILRNGFVTLREGSPLLAPEGATIKIFQSLWMIDSGALALSMDLTASLGESGIFWNTLLIVQKDQIIADAALPANSKWKKFTAVKMNDDHTMLFSGNLDTPTVSGANESFVALARVGPSGQLLETRVLLRKGAPHPAFTGNLNDVLDGDHSIALNNRGDYMIIGRGSGQNSGAILINDTAIAREGESSPIVGRNYTSLSSQSEVDLNDFDDYVFTGSVVNSGGAANNIFLITKNGELFVREDDVLPSLAPAAIGDGAAPPIYITNSGDVFWVAQTNAGDAFMRNYDVIIKEAQPFQGMVVSDIGQIPNIFHVSDDGRFWVGTLDFQGIGSTMMLVDFGLVVPVPGCAANPGTLRLSSGHSIAGGQMRLEMDNGQAAGVVPFVLFSLQPARPGDCGINTRFGELLISPAARFGLAVGPQWVNNGPSQVVVRFPNQLALVDLEYFGQGFFFDVGNQLPGPRVRMTNGIRGQVGAP